MKRMALLATGLSALAMTMAGCSTPRQPSQPAGAHLSVLTYNVNWGMPRAELAGEAIAAADADVVCLQETHGRWEEFLRSRLADRYPQMIFRHDNLPAGGLAVLARLPLKELGHVRPASGWFPAMLVEVQTPLGAVRLLNLHLRPPVEATGRVTARAYLSRDAVHRREIEEAFEILSPNAPLIVAGDFNEGDGGGAARWLARRGLTDALPLFDRGSHT